MSRASTISTVNQSNIPWLMLVEVIRHDAIKEAYLQSGRWGSTLIDDENLDQRQAEWFELAALLYNNPDFEPTTEAFPDLHPDFRESIKLSRRHYNIPQVDGKMIKEQLLKVRGQLMILIDRWEQSGNGAGKRRPDDPKFGHLAEDHQFIESDNRADFLKILGCRSHVLYAWEVFDKEQLLDFTLSRLMNTN